MSNGPTSTLEHIRIPINAIDPHPKNYNQHPEEQLERLEKSLKRFGQVDDLIVKRNGERFTLVAHEGVWLAGCRLYRAGNPDFAEMNATIAPNHWREIDVRAYLVASNELARHSQVEDDLLAALLQEQENAGFDLTALGTDEETLRQMLDDEHGDGGGWGSSGDQEDGDGGDDYEVNPDSVEIRCKVGDIWQLGPHKLAVIDATHERDVARLMQDERADVVWTDPPYGVNYVGKTKDALTIKNDTKFDLDDLLRRAFAAADSVIIDGAAIYVAHPAGSLALTFATRFVAQGWRLHETLIWVKDSMVLGHSDYHYRHEPILFGYKQGAGRRGRGGEGWYGDNSQTSVFEVPRPKRSEEHPTMKPVELIQIMLRNSSPVDGLIYEPFGGSGSTLIAAHRCHMRCNICEIDPRYATVILNRWEAESGQSAQLIESAEGRA